jgi:hypothetical protein
MRVLPLSIAAYLLTTIAWGQLGLQGQPAKNPDLIRALDAASTAFANAQRDAANGQMIPFRESLNVANVRWAECFGKYREWPTQDTAWRPNFDAINTALLNAVNQLTPGNNLAAAKVQIDSAAGTLSSLRTRNGVLDLRATTGNLSTSLKGLQTTIAGLQGRPLTPADVTALKTSFGTFRDSYTLFTQAALDANAFGLGNGQLESLRKLILVQNIGIDSVYNILSNPDTAQLVPQWQSLRDQIVAMLTDLNKNPGTADAAKQGDALGTQPDNGQPAPDNGSPSAPNRPRLFPRLRR